jgi:hypothetical protein
MKTAGLALAKFAIILVCCISPTLGNKRIVRQLRSDAPAFGFYASGLSSDTARVEASQRFQQRPPQTGEACLTRQ